MKKILKGIGIVFVILMAIGVIFGDDSDSDSPTDSQQSSQENKVIETSAKGNSEAAKQDFLAWQKEILSIHQVADDAMKQYQQIMVAMGEGEKDIYSAYSDVNNIKDTVSGAWHAIGKVKVPESLSKEHQKQLKEAQTDLQTGLFSKMEGLKQVLKFLDEQKPSYVEEAKDNFAMSEQFMLSGITRLTGVKMDLGLLEESEKK